METVSPDHGSQNLQSLLFGTAIGKADAVRISHSCPRRATICRELKDDAMGE